MIDKGVNIIVIVGPTASGKTQLSVDIAKKFNGEIISADSMQIYKEFQISTAKPNGRELSEIKHHLMDVISVTENFSVADFVKQAKLSISEILRKGKVPVIVGGTGLYIDSLINNVEFKDEKVNKRLREQLWEHIKSKGPEELIEELNIVDKYSAKSIHPNNFKKLIRAVEFYRTTGIPISKQVQVSRKNISPYNYNIIGLGFNNRESLYKRINARVDDMIKNGLIEEAKCIRKMGVGKTACGAIGYKEFIPYFRGLCTDYEVVNRVKMETRRYAKRQLTWFKRNKNINWFYVDNYINYDGLLTDVIDYFLKNKY